MGWMDSGVLFEAGIPSVDLRPGRRRRAHREEWVDLASVEVCARVLERTARSFCA